MLEKLGLKLDESLKVGEGTVFVALLHADGTAELKGCSIGGMEGVDDAVEIGKGFGVHACCMKQLSTELEGFNVAGV